MALRGGLSTTLNRSIARSVGGRGAGSGGASLLLDTYTGAAAAYSLRKLRSAYSGNAIRVRRSSDSAEQDIGFSGNDLDTSALTTFCGAGDGFVTTWYDQSGNSRNATQSTSTNQPEIVSSGSVVQENSRPTISWGTLASTKSLNWSGTIKHGYTVNTARWQGGATFPTFNGLLTSFSGYGLIGEQSQANWYASSNFVSSQRVNGTPQIVAWTGLLSAISTQSLIVGIDTTYTNRDGVVIGMERTNAGRGWLGNIQEVVIYPDDQSSNISGIESEIATHYGITIA